MILFSIGRKGFIERVEVWVSWRFGGIKGTCQGFCPGLRRDYGQDWIEAGSLIKSAAHEALDVQ